MNTNKKKAVFIHDGSGLTESYRNFYNLLSNDYDLIRIDYDKEKIDLYPKNIDVKQLAKEYLDTIKDYDSIEYLFGWCIGGKIAFEMSRNIKKFKNVIIMNTPPPNNGEPDDFSYKNEKRFAKRNFKIPWLKTNGDNVENVWRSVCTYYEKYPSIFNLSKKFTPIYIKFLTPNFYSDKNTPKHLLSYINLVRSFSNSHKLYKINDISEHAKYYIFNAKLENLDENNDWESYVKQKEFFVLDGYHTEIINRENSFKILNVLGEIKNDKN